MHILFHAQHKDRACLIFDGISFAPEFVDIYLTRSICRGGVMNRAARLGFFILLALSMFSVGIFLIGRSQRLFGKTYRLKARFSSVTGLQSGSEVHMGGVRAGTVSSIELPQTRGEEVLVVMDMDKSTLHLINKDSVASIRPEGLLGNKHISISFGSPNGQPVHDGDTIGTMPGLSSADATEKVNEMLDTTDRVLRNIETATLNMKEVTEKINSGKGTIGQLVNNERLYQEIISATEQVQSTSKDLSETVREAKSGATAFKENMQAIKQTTSDINEITAKINSGEGTIGKLVNDPSIYNEIQSAAANVNSASGNISETVQNAKEGAAAFRDNMEALKHNFLVRSFFKKRGYTDEEELTKNQINRIPALPIERYFVINAEDIFGTKGVKVKHKDRLNAIGQLLQNHPFSLAVIAVYSDMKGDSEKDKTLTQARAVAIRNYLVNNFALDDTRLKTSGLGKQIARNAEPAEGVKLMVYGPSQSSKRQ